MPAVPEQLPPGRQNDAGHHERIDELPTAPSGLPARWCHIIDYAGNPSQKVRRIFSSPGIHIILWIRKIPVLLLRHTLIFFPSHPQKSDILDSPKQLLSVPNILRNEQVHSYDGL